MDWGTVRGPVNCTQYVSLGHAMMLGNLQTYLSVLRTRVFKGNSKRPIPDSRTFYSPGPLNPLNE